ncbi:hypothetical protein KR222_009301 [Zaprionus bogoriensis]|nr:hypothetical protein KR222_009301 [Zaprionus bogoriensis]
MGAFTGTAANQMTLNELQKFSTFDRDNDADAAIDCAARLHGGWWYGACGLT